MILHLLRRNDVNSSCNLQFSFVFNCFPFFLSHVRRPSFFFQDASAASPFQLLLILGKNGISALTLLVIIFSLSFRFPSLECIFVSFSCTWCITAFFRITRKINRAVRNSVGFQLERGIIQVTFNWMEMHGLHSHSYSLHWNCLLPLSTLKTKRLLGVL